MKNILHSFAFLVCMAFSPMQARAFGLQASSSAARSNPPVMACGRYEDSGAPCRRTNALHASGKRCGDGSASPGRTKDLESVGGSILANAFSLAVVFLWFVDAAMADSTGDTAAGTSAGGNLIVYGWVGISAYAGVKGVWDKINESKEE